MWLAVLALSCCPGLDESIAGVRLLDVSTPTALATGITPGEEPVLVVSHLHDRHAARVAASFLEASQPGRRVATLDSRHAPLTLLTGLSVALQSAEDTGHATSAWRDILDRAWSGAVLSSVTGLEGPNTSLRQHVRSWFPNSMFLVRQEPDPLTVSVHEAESAFAGLARDQFDLLVSNMASDPLISLIVSTISPRSVRQVSLPADGRELYGTAEEYQITLIPRDARDTLRPPGKTCPGCGLAAAEPVCDFCRTRTARPTPTTTARAAARNRTFEGLLDGPQNSLGGTP